MKDLRPAIHKEWERGFKLAVQQENNTKFVGGRATTVGASDIGGCLRKSFLDKVNNNIYSHLNPLKK